MKQFIPIATYPSRIEAEIAKSKLDAYGVKSYITADDAGGMRPFPLQYSFGAQLFVEKSKKNSALKILEKKGDKKD